MHETLCFSIQSPSPNSMIYLCGAAVARRSRVWSDHGRIGLGSCSDRFRIVNGVSPVFRAFVVDRIPL